MGAKTLYTRRRFLGLGGLAAGVLCSGCRTAAPLRFGLVTDLHYADREPAGSRFYRDSLDKLQEAVSLFNSEKVDFVIELGDFKDQDSPPEENATLEYLRTVEAVLQKFRGPVYHVLGNHDMDSLSKKQVLENIANSGIAADKSFYSFDRAGFHFVVLDANYMLDGTPYDHGNFDWTETIIPPAELTWLEQDLRAASGPTIVFVHQLLDGEGPHYIKNAGQVRELLEHSGKVLAVFQGHKHDGGDSEIGGIHYITLEAMVEGKGPENNRYYIAELDRNSILELIGYRLAKSRDFKINRLR